MKSNEFVEYIIKDLLSSLRGVTARAMFGGFGIYKDGVMFGLVDNDELYLKVDATNRLEYEVAGSIPFTYETKGGKKILISYWRVPPSALENANELVCLAEKSYNINLDIAVKKNRNN